MPWIKRYSNLKCFFFMNETKKNVKNECVKYIDILFIIKTNKCNDAEIKYSNFSNVSKSLKCLVSFFSTFY